MIGWFLNIIDSIFDSKPKPKLDLKDGDTIVLDNGEVETVKFLDEKEIELLSKAKIKESQSEAVKKVCDDLMALSDEEFDAELRKHMSFEEGQCHPEECEGECDGMGWCEIATDYRNKTDHRKER